MRVEKLKSSLKESFKKYNKNAHGCISNIERDSLINEILKKEFVKKLLENE